MNDDPLVIVSARHLDDLCELAAAAALRLDRNDPLASAVRGAVGQVRAEAVLEPPVALHV